MSKALRWASPHAKCKRCGSERQEHTGDACPTGEGVWRGHSPHGRAATSFNAAEVAMLSELLTGVTQRKDLSVLAKRIEFASLVRKIGKLAESSRATAGDPLIKRPQRDVERRVLRVLAGRSGTFTAKEIAQEIERSHWSVSDVFQRLRQRGVIEQLKHGVWRKQPLHLVTQLASAGGGR